MEFKDLEYISLEGGGGKGVVYLGAINALEELCQNDNTLESEGLKKALMDFKKKDNKELKIKGIAGSSAGAITAFALGIGLNSSDIKKVLNYQFTNFFNEKDSGKYRMVAQDNSLAIGQDHWKKLGAKTESFSYNIEKEKAISNNHFKRIGRHSLISLILSVIVTGIFGTLNGIMSLGSKKNGNDFNFITDDDSNTIYKWNIWRDILTFFQKISWKKKDGNDYLFIHKFVSSQIFTNFALRPILSLFIKGLKEPLKVDIDTITNLIWDRGMYSGFSIREFFYNLIIYAFTRDTYFQRQFLHWYYGGNEKKLSDEILKEKQAVFLNESFEIEETRAVNYIKNKVYFDSNKIVFDRLQSLTFKEFFDITGVDLGFNITNFTTDSPITFSHKHTPDFPILEAVAASMSIPPAIKPLYSEAEVLKPLGYTGKNIKVSISSDVDNSVLPKIFVDEKGEFEMDNYDLLLVATKKYLTERNSIKIDTNNRLNNSNFLYLLLLEIADKITDGYNLDTIFPSVFIENYNIQLNLNVLLFYYNACYKGMLMDGGVTINIPYNYFREHYLKNEKGSPNDSLKNVLAIKLDNTFPPEWLQAAKDILKNSGDKMTNITLLDKEQRTFFGNLFRAQFKSALLNIVNKKSEEEIIKSNLNIGNSLDNLKKESWERIAEEIIKNNRTHLSKIKYKKSGHCLNSLT